MTNPTSSRDPMERVAEEFAERIRRGERPTLKEYTDRYPNLAERIRELFPVLINCEQPCAMTGPPTGPFTDALLEDSQTPHQLGEYRILRKIGQGGMGIVYEALQESLGRHVALKILPYHRFMNPMYLERFSREARAAALLHHTNIVPVFGVGEHAGIHFYAMQYIQGQSLEVVLEELKRLRRRGMKSATTAQSVLCGERVAQGLLTGHFSTGADKPPDPNMSLPMLPIAAASNSLDANSYPGISGTMPDSEYFRSTARMGVQITEALAYAHRNGIFHRDIKPANLLLDTRGVVWITDFGLARKEGSEDLTNTGDLVGTLQYMAPERFYGKSDGRSDIFGVGLTLYEMLTFRPAFVEANKARLIELISHEEPIRPRKLNPHIPRDLETIVLKSIAKDPLARYQSADEMAEDLRRFLADRPVHARRVTNVERLLRWYRRNLSLAVIGTVAVLLLVVLAVGASVAALMLRSRNKEVTENLYRAENAEDSLNRELARSLLEEARAQRYSRQSGQRFKCLEALEKSAEVARAAELGPDWIVKLRKEAIASLALPDLQVDRQWEGCPVGTQNIAFDDSLKLYARRREGGSISVRRVERDEEIMHIPGPGQSQGLGILHFSPDSRYFAATFNPGHKLKVWRLVDGRLVFDGTLLKGMLRADFTPDGRRFIGLRIDGSLVVIDLADLEAGKSSSYVKEPDSIYQWLMGFFPGVRWFPPMGRTPRWIACSPDGRQAAVGMGSTVFIRDLVSGKAVLTLNNSASVNTIAWHPRGNLLAVACENRRVYLWDLSTGKETGRLEGFKNYGLKAVFSRSGEWLATNGWDGMLGLWNVRTKKQVFTVAASLPDLRFSRDGRYLGAQVHGTTVRLFRLEEGLEYRTLVSCAQWEQGSFQDGTISDDGQLFASGMEQGTRIWDLASGNEIVYLDTGGRSPGALFLPNGDLLTGSRSPLGLQRWPLARDSRDTRLYHLGEPKSLYSGLTERIARSLDGKTVAFNPAGTGARLLDQRILLPREKLFSHQNSNYLTVSANGEWLATGTFSGKNVKVWSIKEGKLVRELPCDGSSSPVFSPDNHWLAVGADTKCTLYRVETWEEGLHIPVSTFCCCAFSPDGRILAVLVAESIIAFVDSQTGRVLAELEDPYHDRPSWFGFVPDGARLIVTSSDGQAIHIWNLRRIRFYLAEMNLDWDLPAFPSETSPSDIRPIKIRKKDLKKKIH